MRERIRAVLEFQIAETKRGLIHRFTDAQRFPNRELLYIASLVDLCWAKAWTPEMPAQNIIFSECVEQALRGCLKFPAKRAGAWVSKKTSGYESPPGNRRGTHLAYARVQDNQ